MRYIILFTLAIFALPFTGCEQALDYEKEKAAIIEVMNKETQTYIDRDFEGMFSTHVQDSTNIRLTAGADNYVFAEGWEEVSKHMTGDKTEDDLGIDLHVRQRNFDLHIGLFFANTLLNIAQRRRTSCCQACSNYCWITNICGGLVFFKSFVNNLINS